MKTVTPDIRILKIGSCESVSRKSTLTYHIGCTADGEIHLRYLRQYRRRVLQPGMVAINLHKSGADQGRWSLHLVRPAIPVSRQIPE